MHYNVRPQGDRDRVCTYICMAPASLLSDEDRQLRVNCYKQWHGTTHVPFAAVYSRKHEPVTRENGEPCIYDDGIPRIKPDDTPLLRKLVGIEAY